MTRVKFGKMKSNTGARPVIGMIAQVADDSKKSEADAISTERGGHSKNN